ncbi:MAG: response regulator [Candidatus Omnitrophota bacterium]|nr:response regulator [Candidatus Omnitrophota bacterium]
MANTYNKRILIVDDEEDAVIYLSNILKRADYNVSFAIDGQKGLDLALEFKPDLILLDITLPGMDGFEFLNKLRAKWVELKIVSIPVIMVSAKAETRSMFKAKAAGAADYLVKPVEADTLLHIISRYLF